METYDEFKEGLNISGSSFFSYFFITMPLSVIFMCIIIYGFILPFNPELESHINNINNQYTAFGIYVTSFGSALIGMLVLKWQMNHWFDKDMVDFFSKSMEHNEARIREEVRKETIKRESI